MLKDKSLAVLSLIFSLTLIFSFSPLILPANLFAQDESVTFTTYYPSPYGDYNNLTTNNFIARENVTLATEYGSRVGIGTAEPTLGKLQVNTAGNTWVAIDTNSGSDDASGVRLASVGTSKWYIYNAHTTVGGVDALAITSAAGTPMTILQGGNVGIGTTSPTSLLHLRKDQNLGTFVNVMNQASGSVAFTRYLLTISAANAWFDLYSSDYNGAGAYTPNSASLGTNGAGGLNILSDSPGSTIRFFTAGGAAINERMRITSNGNVGIGTANPNHKLAIKGDLWLESTSTDSAIRLISNTANRISSDYTSTGGFLPLVLSANPGTYPEQLYLNTAGNVGIGTTNPGGYRLYVAGGIYTSGGCDGCSDMRWKKNIMPINNSVALISKLQGVRFNWRFDEYPDMFFGQSADVGLVAQDVEEVMPELVYEVDGYKYLKYERLVPLLIEAVKAQQRQIQNLEQEVRRLK